MNSEDNNDNDAGGHRSNNAPPNNNQSATNHSPYFSVGASRENGSSHAGNAVSSPNRVNWEATAVLLGGSGLSPGVAGIDKHKPFRRLRRINVNIEIEVGKAKAARHGLGYR